jgi:predicted PurR-regulated permease PerM
MEEELPIKKLKVEPLLGAVALLLLLVGCFFVLQPFMTALTWAIILAYSLYPMQRLFTRWFRGSRTLAACFVTLTVAVLFTGPVVLVGVSLAKDGRDLAVATRNWFMATPDQPPEWMVRMPVVGDELEGYWVKFSDARKHWIERLDVEVVKAEKKKAEEEKAQPLRPKIVVETENGLVVKEAPPPASETQAKEGPEPEGAEAESQHVIAMLGKLLVSAKDWLIKLGLAVGQGVTQVLLSAFLAFFLLRDAPELAERLAVAVERLAGQRGRHLIKVAGNTVRGVIFGILATAIAQAVAAGLGFWIAGVPGAVLLAVLTFFFAVVPFGPPMIWIPAAIWLFSQDKTGWGIFMLVWGLLGISSVDNVLRPFIISHGSKMPFALIFCGVIGGALAFGLVGVFLGPTLLAVAFRLIEEWSSSQYAARGESPDEVISELPDEA